MLMYRLIKRVFDIILSFLLLVVLMPVFVVICVLLVCFSGFPAIFKQTRAGQHGKPFVLYKFRTMTNQRDQHGCLLPDSERLTQIGGILRRYSLDELPQLINILRGDMSFVGPRPLPVPYVQLYSAYHRKRLEVPQGLTGWAQVNGRQSLPLSMRRDLDAWYAQNASVCLDIIILLKTVVQVVSAKGVRLGQEMSVVDDIGLENALRDLNK